MNILNSSPLLWLLAAALTYAIYLIGLVIYRLYFHPLAKFPGPRYAAISRWHEFYHECIRGGQFSFVIDEWHEQYGPILRIVPDEIHIKDSQFYDTIFTKAGRVEKYEWTSGRFSSNGAASMTMSPDVHAVRRGALNPLFSRARIVQFEDLIRGKVDVLVARIRGYQESGKPFAFNKAFMAFAGDVIMRFCFDMDYDHLNSEDFRTTFNETFMAATMKSHLSLQFPIIPRILDRLPEAWVERMEPLFALLFKVRRDLLRQILALKNDQEPKAGKSITTVFQSLLNNPDLPAEEKAATRLQDEALVMVGAAISTTGWALSIGAFHIIGNPDIYGRLRKELEEAIPDPEKMPSWTKLEQLPYLTGCVKEAIRLSYPVTARGQRCLLRPVTYQDWVIPTRTPISLTIKDINDDEDIFPEHNKFKPERWINPPPTRDGSSLERYFVCFQKGTRGCLGINLAYCEIFLLMATVFRNFKFELFETDESDVKMVADYFVPSQKPDTKGIRVRCLPNPQT